MEKDAADEEVCDYKYCQPLTEGDEEWGGYHRCSHPEGGPCGGWCVSQGPCDFEEPR